MKKVLMIHEVREEFFDLPLEDYILTFDDGLYSQYYYWPRFCALNTEKLYFISSNIYSRGPQSQDFPTSSLAHSKAQQGQFEDYMTIDQIRELASDPLVTIGGHGHSHKDLKTLMTMADCIQHIEHDTASMLQWFRFNLGLTPTAFCFPYNNDYHRIYPGLLRKHGFTDFYGGDRTPIEMLLRTQPQPAGHDIEPMLP